jgi:AcrR family transcriptional regulator
LARTGRRPGRQDTKEAILAAARDAFAEKGFDGASIRYIATSAGVDPALVHHYFGTKDQLFLAAMQIPIDPGQIIPHVAAGGIDGLGERLVRTFLGIWDSPVGSAGVALLRSAVRNDLAARLFREFITTQVIRRVMSHLDIDPAELPESVRGAVTGAGIAIAALALVAGLIALSIGRRLHRGKRGARVLVLVLSALSLAFNIYALVTTGAADPLSGLVLPTLYLVLLNTRPARDWFRFNRY